MMLKKINRIQKLLKREGLDGLVLGNFGFNMFDEILYYLLLQTPELATIYIPTSGKSTIYCIPFEVAQRQRAYPNLTVRPFDKPIYELYKKHIKKGSKIGVRLTNFPIAAYEKLQNIKGVNYHSFDFGSEVVSQKFPEEIKLLSKACKITDDIYEKLVKNWNKFKTEGEAANFIMVEAAKLGCEVSFPAIIASGRNAADPHYQPEDEKIKKGFCVIDMGVRYKGYCSDMTRTIYIGKPSKKEVSLYENLLNIQKKAITKVKVGAGVHDIDKFVRESLGPKLNKEFIHGLGHGVGSQVHEWPSVSSGSNIILQENMVVTIEPGVYRQGKYGIRIEDDVVVTKKGPDVLSKSSKKLKVIS